MYLPCKKQLQRPSQNFASQCLSGICTICRLFSSGIVARQPTHARPVTRSGKTMDRDLTGADEQDGRGGAQVGDEWMVDGSDEV